MYEVGVGEQAGTGLRIPEILKPVGMAEKMPYGGDRAGDTERSEKKQWNTVEHMSPNVLTHTSSIPELLWG